MSLKKFVDELPIPPVIKAEGKHNRLPYYEVTMKQVKQKLHRDLPATSVWGYNGMYPGPTFEVRRNHPIYVKWKNKLPFNHLLPVDTTVQGAEPRQPAVRTVVHLHGGKVRQENDGYPEAWFTQDFENAGPKFLQEVVFYPNSQRPATLWYHDHAIGITRLNVYAGLAGFYLIRDENEEKLNLPCGKFEIPLVIQDRSFYPNGELFYPSQPGNEPPPAQQPPPPINTTLPNPSIVPEFFGDTILVNGKVWPYLEVEPRKYRFRILNGSNSRFYGIRLSSGHDFVQIGTDGGFLEKPIKVSRIILAPAERVDVIIDFKNFFGQSIILTNDATAPFPAGDPPSADLSQILKFRVREKLSKTDRTEIPKKLACLNKLNPNEAISVRRNELVESKDEFGRPKLFLNNMGWDEIPITETPYNGTVEIWEIYNTTPDTHPIHLHLISFQILNRSEIIVASKGNDYKIGPPKMPDPTENGWKDTVRANSGTVTRLIARFGPYTGIYPWHCHILEHEVHDMMRPYEVLTNSSMEIPKELAHCFDCDDD